MTLKSKNIKLGASGILLNQFGMVLLGKRADKEDLGGLWCTPGGGLEYGESIDHCIRREFEEETELHVRVGRLMYVSENLKSGRPHSVLVFKQVYLEPGLAQRLAPNRKEFSELRFVAKGDLTEAKLTPSTYRALCAFYSER